MKRNLDADAVEDSSEPEQNDSDIELEQPDEGEIVNVDFDFFDFADIDFHATKRFLTQLLDVDNTLLDLSAITDIILDKNITKGTTVKVVDDESQDPYAFLAVIDVAQAQDKDVIKALFDYMCKRTVRKAPELSGQLRKMFATKSHRLGLVLSERMINMPVQIAGPLYKLYLDEVVKDSSLRFDSYVVLSKAFTEVDAKAQKAPNSKVRRFANPQETYYFHPEDEVLVKHAASSVAYDFNNPAQNSDSRRAFQQAGIEPNGFVVLFEGDKLEQIVKDIQDIYI